MPAKVDQRIRVLSDALDSAYNEFHAAPSGSIKACDSAIIRMFDILQDVVCIVAELTKK